MMIFYDIFISEPIINQLKSIGIFFFFLHIIFLSVIVIAQIVIIVSQFPCDTIMTFVGTMIPIKFIYSKFYLIIDNINGESIVNKNLMLFNSLRNKVYDDERRRDFFIIFFYNFVIVGPLDFFTAPKKKMRFRVSSILHEEMLKAWLFELSRKRTV